LASCFLILKGIQEMCLLTCTATTTFKIEATIITMFSFVCCFRALSVTFLGPRPVQKKNIAKSAPFLAIFSLYRAGPARPGVPYYPRWYVCTTQIYVLLFCCSCCCCCCCCCSCSCGHITQNTAYFIEFHHAIIAQTSLGHQT
jgi:hypothetical protein